MKYGTDAGGRHRHPDRHLDKYVTLAGTGQRSGRSDMNKSLNILAEKTTVSAASKHAQLKLSLRCKLIGQTSTTFCAVSHMTETSPSTKLPPWPRPESCFHRRLRMYHITSAIARSPLPPLLYQSKSPTPKRLLVSLSPYYNDWVASIAVPVATMQPPEPAAATGMVPGSMSCVLDPMMNPIASDVSKYPAIAHNMATWLQPVIVDCLRLTPTS